MFVRKKSQSAAVTQNIKQTKQRTSSEKNSSWKSHRAVKTMGFLHNYSENSSVPTVPNNNQGITLKVRKTVFLNRKLSKNLELWTKFLFETSQCGKTLRGLFMLSKRFISAKNEAWAFQFFLNQKIDEKPLYISEHVKRLVQRVTRTYIHGERRSPRWEICVNRYVNWKVLSTSASSIYGQKREEKIFFKSPIKTTMFLFFRKQKLLSKKVNFEHVCCTWLTLIDFFIMIYFMLSKFFP